MAESESDRIEKQPAIAPWWMVILAMSFPTFVTWFYFYVLADYSDATQKLGMGFGKSIQFGLPVFWLIVIRRWKNNWRWPNSDSMWLGFLFGAVTFAVAVAAWHLWLKNTAPMQQAAVEITNKVAGMGLSSPMSFIALGAFYTVCHSLMEEYYWRWFVFGMLRQRMAVPMAILVSSLGFMSHHVLVLAKFFGWASIGAWFFSLCVAVGGAFWAWQYNKTGRLYPAWIGHALVDAAIFTIGYSMLPA